MYPEVINWKQNSPGFVFWITVNSVNSIQKSKKNQENHFFTAWTVTEGKFSFQKFELFLNYCSHGGKVEIIFKILVPTIFWIYNFLFLFFWIFHFFKIFCSSVNGSDPVKTGQGERRVEFWPVLRVGGCRLDGFGVGGCILD